MNEHTLSPDILKDKIIALHKAAFEALFYDKALKPGATDKHLNALVEFYSCSETLALHYRVKFGDIKDMSKRILMLADAGKPEPESLGELEKTWLADLEKRKRSIPNMVCNGCGRNELHKMCPAWGTPIYCNPEHPEWGKATDERLAELRPKNATPPTDCLD